MPCRGKSNRMCLRIPYLDQARRLPTGTLSSTFVKQDEVAEAFRTWVALVSRAGNEGRTAKDLLAVKPRLPGPDIPVLFRPLCEQGATSPNGPEDPSQPKRKTDHQHHAQEKPHFWDGGMLDPTAITRNFPIHSTIIQ